MDEARGHYAKCESQTHKDKYCMILLIRESKRIKLLEEQSRIVASRGCRVRDMKRYWSKDTKL